MSCFVQGDGTLLGGSHDLGLLLQTADDTVDGIQEVLFSYRLPVTTGSDKGGLVAHVGDVGTRESRCLP